MGARLMGCAGHRGLRARELQRARAPAWPAPLLQPRHRRCRGTLWHGLVARALNMCVPRRRPPLRPRAPWRGWTERTRRRGARAAPRPRGLPRACAMTPTRTMTRRRWCVRGAAAVVRAWRTRERASAQAAVVAGAAALGRGKDATLDVARAATEAMILSVVACADAAAAAGLVDVSLRSAHSMSHLRKRRASGRAPWHTGSHNDMPPPPLVLLATRLMHFTHAGRRRAGAPSGMATPSGPSRTRARCGRVRRAAPANAPRCCCIVSRR